MNYNLSIKLVRDLDHNYEYIDDNYKPIIVSDANYWILLLLPLPLCCVFGNGLVVIAVFTNRSLKTCTNFLLVCSSSLTRTNTFVHKCVQVSLAVADLIVGALVMPFSIYMAVCSRIYCLAT